MQRKPFKKRLIDVAEVGSIIDVYGNGTRELLGDEFWCVDKLKLPGPGILLEQVPQRVDTGKDFQISGRLISDTEVDSVTLYRDGNLTTRKLIGSDGEFSFTDRLRAEGPALYHIETETADTLRREPLHIRAVAPDPLAVAVLLYSPSFEIMHLAEWLGKSGHRLAMRTRIGNDRFRFDEINDPPAAESELVSDLSSFDLVTLDPREVPELSAGQIQSVRLAIENGLDVMLLPPSENSTGNWEEARSRFKVSLLN